MGKEKREYKIGEIYWAHLNGKDHVQHGWHPVVIIQNNIGNKYSNTLVTVPITSRIKSKLPTHIRVKSGSFGLRKDSTIQCEGSSVIDKSWIGDYIGVLNDEMMKKVAKGCLINTPFLSFLDKEDISNLLN